MANNVDNEEILQLRLRKNRKRLTNPEKQTISKIK